MDIINVGLYGGKSIFGGKEAKLEASIIRCDRYNECDFYKRGECWNVRNMTANCSHGKVERLVGYTSRAQKYGEFKRKWETHDDYSKLKVPHKKLGVAGDYVIVPYNYLNIREEDGKYKLKDPSFAVNKLGVKKEDFDVEMVKKIVDFKPQAMMGGVIKSYQKEEVPKFLVHLKEEFPELFEEFMEKYDYDFEIDHVGRKAKLSTLEKGIVTDQLNYEEWYWDGELLHYERGKLNIRIDKKYEVETLRIRPDKDLVVYVKDNETVSEITEFID